MGKDRDKSKPRQRLSPLNTVLHLSDDFIEDLHLPKLPDQLPERLEEALRRRVSAFLFCLKQAQKERYIPALEIRLIRDAQRAVLTAYELGLDDSEVHYAEFRRLVEELGYERTEVGFARRRESR